MKGPLRGRKGERIGEVRLFDVNKDGKLGGLEKAVYLAWLADSLEAADGARGDRERTGSAKARDGRPELKRNSDRTAGILLAVALLAGLAFLLSTLGVALVGEDVFYPAAVISGIVFILGLVSLLVYVRMDA